MNVDLKEDSKVKVIRYADEGFKNYATELNLEGECVKAEGCYAFVKKIKKGALIMPTFLVSQGVRHRDSDARNEALLDGSTPVYGRIFTVDAINLWDWDEVVRYDCRPLWGCYDLSFRKTTLKEVEESILRYENMVAGFKKSGKRIVKKGQIYPLYEVFIDSNLVFQQIKANPKVLKVRKAA